MDYKDILAPVVTLERDLPALQATARIAEAFQAHATALIVSVHLSSAFSEKSLPLSEILSDIASGSQSSGARERERIKAWLQRSAPCFEIRDVTIEDAVTFGAVLAHARVTDIVVCSRRNANERSHRALFDRVLFDSGRPVLLIPGGERRAFAWKRVLIGWNAKVEAMRAVIGAMPFLQAAEEVRIATVDAIPSQSGHGEAPGRELAGYLARRGVNAVVRNLDGLGRSDGDTLLGEAEAFDADLVVLGAYGRPRAAEFVFGGVTHEVLNRVTPPLLLSH